MKYLLFGLTLFLFGLNTKAINAPTLSSPANASSVSLFTVTLIANQVTGAAGYQFQLDSVNTFTSVSRWTDTATFRAIGSPALKTGKTYFWRVRCYAGPDTSLWSAVFSFTTTLGTTQIFSPPNNGSGPIVDLRANNLGLSPNVRYLFEVDTTAALNSGFKVLRVLGTNQFIDTNVLTYGRRVFWRARVFNSLGDTFAWSAIWNYTMHTAPTLNGSSNITIVDPQFYPSWATAGLSTIVLQIDTSPSFNTIKLEERNIAPGRTLDTLSNLFFGKDYFYRIKLKYGLNQTPWSVSRQIRVKTNGNITNPSNGSTLGALIGSFSWGGMVGTRYQVQFYNDSALTQLLRDTVTSNSNFPANHPLQLNKWYRWRLRYFHALDTTPWLVGNFKTYTGMVNLGMPTQNGTNIIVRPRLSFRKQTWGTSHVMEIDTGTNFGSSPSSYFIRMVDSFAYDGSFYHYLDTSLRYGQKYVWRVYALKGNDTAEATVRNFTTTAAPINYFPQNNYIGIGTQTDALITGIAGSTWVGWELDTSLSFSSPHKFSGVNAHKPDDFTPQYVEVLFPPDLLFHVKYFWRTRCINSIDTSNWSTPFNFTTTQDMFLTNPANGSVNQALATKIEWSIQGSSNHLRYQYQLATDSNFATKPIVTLPALNTSNTTVNVNYGATYFWRVRAFNGLDTSRWSEIRRFSTLNPPAIGVPTLQLPANGAKNVGLTNIQLSWSFSVNALTFDVEVSTDVNFSTIAASGNTQSNAILFNGAQPKTRYYWHVRGRNGSITSQWATARWFETVPPVGIDESGVLSPFSIYPNPTKDFVSIQSEGPFQCQIFDLEGRKVYESIDLINEANVSVQNFKPGMYQVIVLKDGKYASQKLLVLPNQ